MSLATTLAIRILVTLLAVTAVVGQLAYLDALSSMTLGLSDSLGSSRRPAFFTVIATHAVLSAVAGFLAVALATRGDPRRGALGLGLALGSWSYMLAYSGVGLLLRPEAGAGRALFDAHFSLVELVGLAGLIRFTSLFPRPIAAARLAVPESLAVGLRSMQHLRIRLLAPNAPWIWTILVLAFLLGTNAVQGRPMADAALSPVMDIIRFLAIGLVVLNLRFSWRDSDAAMRDSMWWLVVGFALLIGLLVLLVIGNILLSAAEWPEPPFPWRPMVLDLGIVGFLWGLSMAVFYAGPMKGAVVLRQSLSVIGVVSLGILLATGLEVLISGSLVAQVALPPGLGAITSILVVGTTSRMSMGWFGRMIEQVQHRMESAGAS